MPVFLFSQIKKILFLLILVAGSEISFVAQADTAQDSTVLAALTLNFARFTEWPANVLKTGDPTIRLCVLGDNVAHESFDEVDKKQVGDRILEVIKMVRVKNVDQCHLLYVSNLDRSTTIQLLSNIRKQHILTINGDDEHFLRDGGMVALVVVEGKINIEINLGAVKEAGLQINSRVLKLATIFKP